MKVRNSVSRTGYVRELPPQAKLRVLFRYDKKTGHLYWRERINASIKLGVPISLKQKLKGERPRVRIDGILYATSRVIWRLMTGHDPGGNEIDHEDRDHCNDAWENLRLATRKQNLANRRSNHALLSEIAKSRHKSGTLGRSTWTPASEASWRKKMGYDNARH
jgi:hypothetical protein